MARINTFGEKVFMKEATTLLKFLSRALDRAGSRMCAYEKISPRVKRGREKKRWRRNGLADANRIKKK